MRGRALGPRNRFRPRAVIASCVSTTGLPYALDHPSPAPGLGPGADELHLAAPVQSHAGHRVAVARGGRVAPGDPALAEPAGHGASVRCVRAALRAGLAHDPPTPPLAAAGQGVAPSVVGLQPALAA